MPSQLGNMSEHPALQSLTSFASGSGEIGDVVRELSHPASQIRPESERDLENYLWKTWSTILKVAAETPHQEQGRLVELMVKLRGTSVKHDDAQGTPVRHGAAGKVWKDLPVLGWVAREIWNFDLRDGSSTPKQQAGFNNQAAFLARLTARANVQDNTEPLNYSLYALWAMRDAFEEEHENQGTTASDTLATHNLAMVTNAAMWILYSCGALRRLVASQHQFPDRLGIAGDRYVNRSPSSEWRGFNKDRWALWKAGFEATRGLPGQDPEAGELIEKAVAFMGKLA